MSAGRQFEQSPGRQFVQSPGRQRNRGGVFARALITVEVLQGFVGFLPFGSTGLVLEETRYLHSLRVVQMNYLGDTRRREVEVRLDPYSGLPIFFEDRDSCIEWRSRLKPDGTAEHNPLNNAVDNPCFDVGTWGGLTLQSSVTTPKEIVRTYWDGVTTIGTDTITLTEEWTLAELETAAEAALAAIEAPGNYVMRDKFADYFGNPQPARFHYGFEPEPGSTLKHINFAILVWTTQGVEITSLYFDPGANPGNSFPQAQRYITWEPTLVADTQTVIVHLKKGRYRTPDGVNEVIEDWLGTFSDANSQHWASETAAANPTRWGQRTPSPGTYLFPVPPRSQSERHSYFGLRVPGG